MDTPVDQKISAVVMIYNEEAQIRQCLETIAWVDEIVICDSFSTDKTIAICREFTDKIFQRAFDDFGSQKKWLLDKPTYSWVLFVEADERFSPELAAEIRERLSLRENVNGYWMRYENYIFGRRMKGKFWQDNRIKLYRKGAGSWEARKVHSRFILEGPSAQLQHPVSHYPYRNFPVMCAKISRYTTLEAKELLQSKARVTALDTFKALAWIPMRFAKFFFAWKDYQSGWPGFIHAAVTSWCPLLINGKYWIFRSQDQAR